MAMLADTLRELTLPSLAIPWELVLKSLCSADGMVLSHNRLVKTIWGWAWEGSAVDDVVVGDNVENLGSDRGTRMTDIGKGTARNALFCCQNAVFDVLMSIRRQRSKDGGSRALFNNAYASSFWSPEPAVGSAISLYHDERARFMSRLSWTDPACWRGCDRQPELALLCSGGLVGMRESRAKVRHSCQTQGDWPRNAPHVQCEQTDYCKQSSALRQHKPLQSFSLCRAVKSVYLPKRNGHFVLIIAFRRARSGCR
jgi:hypothetical protein